MKLFLILTIMIISCIRSPYEPCAQNEWHAWRCAENTQELCNGHYWQPVFDCDPLWDETGSPVSRQCVEEEGETECI